MSEILSGILGSIITLFISPIFVKNNNEQNSLNDQSDWRKKLSELSCQEDINRDSLNTFRYCLSSLRGFENNRISEYDLRFNKKKMYLDDTCLQYYNYILKSNTNFFNEKNILYSDQAKVIRFLCFLLLKCDWREKILKNKPFYFLKFTTYYDLTELKAVYIIRESISKSDPKYLDFTDSPVYKNYYNKVSKMADNYLINNNDFKMYFNIKKINYTKMNIIIWIIIFIIGLLGAMLFKNLTINSFINNLKLKKTFFAFTIITSLYIIIFNNLPKNKTLNIIICFLEFLLLVIMLMSIYFPNTCIL